MENHCAAVSLYVAHYNLCLVHETIRMTPAMALGVTLGIVAMLTNTAIFLIVICIIPVIESLSVIIQVLSKKIRKKKKRRDQLMMRKKL